MASTNSLFPTIFLKHILMQAFIFLNKQRVYQHPLIVTLVGIHKKLDNCDYQMRRRRAFLYFNNQPDCGRKHNNEFAGSLYFDNEKEDHIAIGETFLTCIRRTRRSRISFFATSTNFCLSWRVSYISPRVGSSLEFREGTLPSFLF